MDFFSGLEPRKWIWRSSVSSSTTTTTFDFLFSNGDCPLWNAGSIIVVIIMCTTMLIPDLTTHFDLGLWPPLYTNNDWTCMLVRTLTKSQTDCFFLWKFSRGAEDYNSVNYAHLRAKKKLVSAVSNVIFTPVNFRVILQQKTWGVSDLCAVFAGGITIATWNFF